MPGTQVGLEAIFSMISIDILVNTSRQPPEYSAGACL